jgi:hypothetical protein
MQFSPPRVIYFLSGLSFKYRQNMLRVKTISTSCLAVQIFISLHWHQQIVGMVQGHIIISLNRNVISVSWLLYSQFPNIKVLIDFKTLSRSKESANGQCSHSFELVIKRPEVVKYRRSQELQVSGCLMQLWERDATSKVSSKKDLSLSSSCALQGAMQSLHTSLGVCFKTVNSVCGVTSISTEIIFCAFSNRLPRNPIFMAVGTRCADHTTPFYQKRWQ